MSDHVAKAVNTLLSGEVTRYHAVPSVSAQTVGLHSWGVAVIINYVTAFQATARLLTEALMHDTGELFTGDIPFTVKRDNPELKERLHALERAARRDFTSPEAELTPREAALLKVADTLEGFIWCSKHEVRGPVGGRWHEAYHVCKNKFGNLLTEDEWKRADELFLAFLTQ